MEWNYRLRHHTVAAIGQPTFTLQCTQAQNAAFKGHSARLRGPSGCYMAPHVFMPTPIVTKCLGNNGPLASPPAENPPRAMNLQVADFAIIHQIFEHHGSPCVYTYSHCQQMIT